VIVTVTNVTPRFALGHGGAHRRRGTLERDDARSATPGKRSLERLGALRRNGLGKQVDTPAADKTFTLSHHLPASATAPAVRVTVQVRDDDGGRGTPARGEVALAVVARADG